MRSIDIRRALLAVLIDADRPLTVNEIVDRLAGDHGVVLDGRQVASARQRVADMARYQVRRGRVRRVGRGRYVGIRVAMSRSMAWRCHNWRLLRDRFFRSRTGVATDVAARSAELDPMPRSADCGRPERDA